MTPRIRRLRARARALLRQWLRAERRANRVPDRKRGGQAKGHSPYWRADARALRLRLRGERAEAKVREERG